jgi:hypothetical protein
MAAALPDDIEGCCQHDLHERIMAAAGDVLRARFAAVIRAGLRTSFVFCTTHASPTRTRWQNAGLLPTQFAGASRPKRSE